MKLFPYGSTAVLSVLMAGALSAQAPQPPAAPMPEQPPAPAAAPAADPADITIVGCLARSDDAAETYTLTVVPAADAHAAAGARTESDVARTRVPDPAAPDATRAARDEDARAASTPASYKIVGLASAQLKPHVNHQVELKGRLNAAAAPSAQASASSPQEFRATSVKMLNATCPAAQ